VPAFEVKQLRERLLGRKTQETEILRDALELVREKKSVMAVRLAKEGRHLVKAIARALGYRARLGS